MIAHDGWRDGSKPMLCRPSFGFGVQCLDDSLRIPCDHSEQSQGWSVRCPPSLLPVPERRHAHANQERECRLGRAELGPDRLHIGWVKRGRPGRTSRPAPNLARLPYAREQFPKCSVIHLNSSRTTRLSWRVCAGVLSLIHISEPTRLGM